MSSIHVRPARLEEAAILSSLIQSAFEQYRGRLVPESGAFDERPDRIARELAEPGHGGLLALDDTEPVGCVMVKPQDGDLYFGRLSVSPRHRGRGIARLLIDAVEAHAVASGFPAVVLGVRVSLPDNQQLFASLGYREISRSAHPGFDYPTSITMRKPVP